MQAFGFQTRDMFFIQKIF